MRLHDIQVILSSSDVSSKYQQVYQYQVNVMQAQNAMTMIAQTNQKMTQTQELLQGRELTAINENENRLRAWKKEHFSENKRNINKKNIKQGNLTMIDFEHVIDIKA